MKTKGQRNWGTIFASIVLIATLTLLGVLLCWSLRPYALPTATIEVVSTEVRPGDTIDLILTIDKPAQTQTPIVAVVQICDTGVIYTLEAQSLNAPPTDGPQSFPSSRFSVPDETRTGQQCYLQFRNDYPVNPIRSDLRVWDSNKYTIIE